MKKQTEERKEYEERICILNNGENMIEFVEVDDTISLFNEGHKVFSFDKQYFWETMNRIKEMWFEGWDNE